ncbi:MAG: hypothetical protein ACRCXZ_04755 [Patescibacteria group bacterium]
MKYLLNNNHRGTTLNLYDILIKQVQIAGQTNNYLLLHQRKKAAIASLTNDEIKLVIDFIHLVREDQEFVPCLQNCVQGILFYVIRHQVCIAYEHKDYDYLLQVKKAAIGALSGFEVVNLLSSIDCEIHFVIEEFENLVTTLKFDDAYFKQKIEQLLETMSLETRVKYQKLYKQKLFELQEIHKNKLRTQCINTKATWIV